MKFTKRLSIVSFAIALLVSSLCIPASAAEYKLYGRYFECGELTMTRFTTKKLEETEQVTCSHQGNEHVNPEIYDTFAEYKITTTYYCESCGCTRTDEQEVKILIKCPCGALD